MFDLGLMIKAYVRGLYETQRSKLGSSQMRTVSLDLIFDKTESVYYELWLYIRYESKFLLLLAFTSSNIFEVLLKCLGRTDRVVTIHQCTR